MIRAQRVLVIILIMISHHINSDIQAQNKRRLCLHMKSQTLQKGQILTTEADHYYTFPDGKIVSYFYQPEEYVFISNPLGEARIYHPGQNKVVLESNELFTTRNNSLYYFLTNQLYDLGLKNLGLKVYDSEEDGNYIITRWQAPIHMLQQVDKIEMVHENSLPVYSSYRNTKGDITLKVYFEDFSVVEGSQIPNRITEIVFLADGDSLIKRTDYTKIRSGLECDQSKFNFTIPENATISK